MKYLKYIKEYSTYLNEDGWVTNNIKEACEDILIDLKDDGYIISINQTGTSNRKHEVKGHIHISIEGMKKFRYSDISGTIDRLTSYLKSEGYSRLKSKAWNNENDWTHDSYIVNYLED